jgi:hypothetical protein
MPGALRRSRRRRCPFCQTLFRPHPRLGSRQWTCGAPACQQQRHAENCRAWRRRNPAVTRSHYQDYVVPARAAARRPAVPPSPSPVHAQLILASLRPEWRDAIMAQGQQGHGVRAP